LSTTLHLAHGTLDLAAGVATVGGEVHSLTPIEVAALSVLSEAAPEPVSERELLAQAWGYKATASRAVSVGISRLRAKIELDPKAPSALVTVRGKGYRLVLVDPIAAMPPVSSTIALGRKGLIHTVREHFRAGARVVELVGPGGVGKTTIAEELASKATWVDLLGTTTEAALLRRLAGALGGEGPDGRASIAEALAHTGHLILDNAEDLGPEARALLAELLDDARGEVLVTTREPLGLGERVPVGALDDDDALRVVNRSRAAQGQAPVDAQALAPTLEAFGGYALALVVAAPLLELGARPADLLDVPGLTHRPHHPTLSQVIEASLQGLSDTEREVMAMAAACAVPPALDTLAAMASQPVPALLRAVHRARERGLVTLLRGSVVVHPFVRQVAVSVSSRERHTAWLARHPVDPLGLRPIRAEVELGLAHASGERLARIVLRHLVIIHHYGPADRTLDDVAALLNQLPADGIRPLIWGAALLSANEMTDALASLQEAEGQLPEASYEWRAWCWLFLAQASAWTNHEATYRASGPQLLSLREHVGDVALWGSMTLNAAHSQPWEVAEPLFREVEARADELPHVSLMASFARLHLGHPTPRETRWIEQRLAGIGEDTLGTVAWSRFWVKLGGLWLRADERQRGLALLRRWAPVFVERRRRAGNNALAYAAALCLDTPAHAAELEALMLGDDPWRDRLRWLLSDQPGPPPSDDPELGALLAAFRAGEPITETRGWRMFSRALMTARARHVERAPDAP